jgi:hypothetical protein
MLIYGVVFFLIGARVLVVVVTVLLELQTFWVSHFRYNGRIAVGLVCADNLIGFKDKTGHIHVRIVLNCFDDFVTVRLVEGVKQNPLGSRQSLIAGGVKVGYVWRITHGPYLGDVGLVLQSDGQIVEEILHRQYMGRMWNSMHPKTRYPQQCRIQCCPTPARVCFGNWDQVWDLTGGAELESCQELFVVERC